MPGSLRKRTERGPDAWALRVFIGRDRQGRVRHKCRIFRGSKRAVEKELSPLVLAQDFEPEAAPEPETLICNQTTTVNDAIAGWKENGWGDFSPVSLRRYEHVWKVHIEKSIGRERIATPTPYDDERHFCHGRGADMTSGRGLKGPGRHATLFAARYWASPTTALI